MGAVYSLFTATATTKTSQNSMAIVRVGFTNETTSTITSGSITKNTLILPGEKLSISGAVQNTGDSDIYIILHFEITLQKQDEEDTTIVDKYFTFAGSNMVEIAVLQGDNPTYTQNAKKLTANKTTLLGETVNFALDHDFDFYEYDNSYQGATAHYCVTAKAIQFKNLDSASHATTLIMQNENKQ